MRAPKQSRAFVLVRSLSVLAAAGPWLMPSVFVSWFTSPLFFLPALLLFFGFSAGLLGWGALVERRAGGGWPAALLYATILAVAFVFFFGHLGLLGEGTRFAAALYLGAGAWMLVPRLVDLRQRLRVAPATERFFFAAVAVCALMRFFAAFAPQAHGDPLLYHLLGPKLWVSQGAIRLHPELPNALLASSWEYLYVWPQLWWQKADVANLVAAQVFSQWMHLWWGWVGAGLLVFAILRELKVAPRTAALMAFASLFASGIQWTGGLAKNDCGVAFWSLGAFWMLLRGGPSFVAGALAGLAVVGKINTVLFLAPALSFLAVYRWWKSPRGSARWAALGWLTAGAMATALPFYLRNYLEAGSPFFPMFQAYWPSPWVSQSWADNFSSVQPKEYVDRAAVLLTRIHQLSRESPLIFGWLLLPLFFFSPWRREGAPLRGLAVFLLVMVACFCTFFALTAELRYLGAGLALAVALGAGFFLLAAEPFPRLRAPAAVLVFLVVLAGSKLPFHMLRKVSSSAYGEAAVLQHTAGDAKAWVRQNVPANELVVVFGGNENYYLSNSLVTVLVERPDIDAATYGVKDFRVFIDGLCRTSGARYLLDERPFAGMGRFPAEAATMPTLFRGTNSFVYDLAATEKALGLPVRCGISAKSR